MATVDNKPAAEKTKQPKPPRQKSNRELRLESMLDKAKEQLAEANQQWDAQQQQIRELAQFKQRWEAVRFLDEVPNNESLERETLCAVMLGNKFAGECFGNLEPDDFYCELYRAMFLELRQAWVSGVAFDTPALLVQWIRDSGVLKRIKPLADHNKHEAEAFLLVMRSEGLAHHAGQYCKALRQLRIQRKIRGLLLDSLQQTQPPEWWVAWMKGGLAIIEKQIENELQRR